MQIKDLPVEITYLILSFIDSPKDLGNAMLSHSTFYLDQLGRCTLKKKFLTKVKKKWPNGKKKEVYFIGQDGQREEMTTEYFWKGDVFKKVWYCHGKRNGIYQEWRYSDRNYSTYLQKEAFYKNGLLNGTRKRFHKNGKLYEECEYIDGQKNGNYQKWNSEGKLCEKGLCYPNGKRTLYMKNYS